MHAEQLDILDFLRRYPPFSDLPEATLGEVAQAIEISYFKAGTQILSFNQEVDALYVIRSGAVEIYRRNGELYNRLSEGGYFAEFGLLRNGRVRFPVTALEDTLVYLIPANLFTELFEKHELFADFVEVEDRTRLRQAVARREDANELMSARVEVLINRDAVTVDADASALEAAQRMAQEGVSSLLVVASNSVDIAEDTTPGVRVAGILTDRDLRNRLLAKGLDYTTPVAHIMTVNPVSVQHNQLVFEAMLLMLRHNVHHLPVLKHNQPLSVIALSDIIQYESQNSLFVVGSIFRAQDLNELQTLTSQVHTCFNRMVQEDANSRMIGSAMAVIGRSFKQRLLELAEARLGPPPIPYCFLALGSMARDEQTLVTDQDNALVLDNRYDPGLHGEYFEQLATFVCDGLHACGYPHCKGGIMATNPRWRKPLAVWENYFQQWIESPTPESLLNSSIFFDLDGVWGRTDFADQLNRLIRRQARRNANFLACMARNALLRTPPLGFFKDFVMETDGRHTRTINVKRRGTAPLADLIRVHALAVGSQAHNSFDRLQDVIAAGILPPGRGPDLRDALELISLVRIRHQALELGKGIPPDNSIEPERLSDFERKNLKDAFQIISHAQKFLKYRYQPNRIN